MHLRRHSIEFKRFQIRTGKSFLEKFDFTEIIFIDCVLSIITLMRNQLQSKKLI